VVYTVEEAIDRVLTAPRPFGAKEIADEIRQVLRDRAVDAIYRDRVLSGRSRQYNLPLATEGTQVEIIHTLLGIELKIGRRRLLCPDYATARYLSVFARLGGGQIAVPYDITGISIIADELESSLQWMFLLADLFTRERSPRIQSLVRRRLAATLSQEIARLGSGAKFPEFTPPRRKGRR